MLSIRRNQIKECAMYSNNIAVYRVKCGNKVLHVHGRQPTVSTNGITAFDVPAIAIVNAAQTS
jgi:hypothetical protein